MRLRPIKNVLNAENFKSLINELYSMFSSLTLDDNFSSDIVSVTIPANTEKRIMHRLKVVPKYRIILNCTGTNDIIDGDSTWTDTEIYLKNINATLQSNVTVMILRG